MFHRKDVYLTRLEDRVATHSYSFRVRTSRVSSDKRSQLQWMLYDVLAS